MHHENERSNQGKARAGIIIAALLACCGAGSALGDNAVPAGDDGAGNGLARLLARYPALQTTTWNGRTMAVAGVPMTRGATPEAAASAFVAQHMDAFGAGEVQQTVSRVNDIAMGEKTVFAYEQWMDGMKVEFGTARVLVLNQWINNEPSSVVTFASAKLAQRPEGGFKAVTTSAEDALKAAREIPRFASMDVWSAPEMVVYMGEGDFEEWITPVKAWKFVGEHSDVAKAQRWTFFVDSATGELVHARNEVLHVDITGQVRGNATLNNDADRVGNPPGVRDVPEIQVRVQGTGTSVFTDRDGNFTIPWSGTAPVTLEVGVANGLGMTVNDASGLPEILVTQSATPGTPASILLNAIPAENTTSQMNAFIHQTITRNFFRDRAPTFTALNPILPANVMVNDTCNAFYNGVSTNFFPAGGGCNNTTIPSVVAHEYGHHIVNRLGLAQGAFGEGFSDTMALLIYNDAVVGRGFTDTGGAIRNPDTANRQYPCTSTAIHTCGLIIGGVTWDIRTGFVNRDGSVNGLENARQLHVDWAQTTNGGEGLNSAHPTMALEYLAVDDNDGNLCNGTPNYSIIRTGFTNHGISVPNAETRVNFGVALEIPTYVISGQTLAMDFDISPGTATFAPGDVSGSVRLDSGDSYSGVPMTQIAPNRYRLELTNLACGDVVEAFVRVVSSEGVVILPNGCGLSGPITVPVYDDIDDMVDEFETAVAGWSVGPDTATAGNWIRGNPIGTAAQPEDDRTSTGVSCWFTGQGTVGGALGAADVDGGATVLTSPAFNIAGFVPSQTSIEYSRWFSNGAGATPYTDTFLVDARIDGGAWVNVETVGPGSASDPNTNPGWIDVSWTMTEKGLPAGSTLQLRFTAQDLADGSLVEAAIDDLRIASFTCNAGCDGIDFNNDGLFPDDQDLIDFLAVSAGGACSPGNTCNDLDFNNDGLFPDDADLVAFLTVLAGGACE